MMALPAGEIVPVDRHGVDPFAHGGRTASVAPACSRIFEVWQAPMVMIDAMSSPRCFVASIIA
jgi:hypothetical protein